MKSLVATPLQAYHRDVFLFRLVAAVAWNLIGWPLALGIHASRRLAVWRRRRIARIDLSRGVSTFPMAWAWPARPSWWSLHRLARRARTAGNLHAVVVELGDRTLNPCDASELERLIECLDRPSRSLWVCTGQLTPGVLRAAGRRARIALAPAGTAILRPPTVRALFAGRALHSLGIDFDVARCGAFKAFAEPLTRDRPSAAFESNLCEIAGDLEEMWREAIEGRVEDAAPAPIAPAATALEAGWVDGAAYPRDLYASLDVEANTKRERTRRPLAFEALPLQAPRPLSPRRRPRIAVVSLAGVLVDEPAPHAARGTVAAAFEALVERLARRRDLVALVVTIDSRGGSVLASDRIHAALEWFGAERPVVAWFGRIAASGGFYAACAARRIVAAPTALTGSVGVISVKPVAERLARRAGVREWMARAAQGATLDDVFRPWTETDRTAVETVVEAAYRRFVEVVATGRHMDPERAESLAAGRVWTGRRAVEVGLVDRLGTAREAVEDACALAGVDPDWVQVVVASPKPAWRTWLQPSPAIRGPVQSWPTILSELLALETNQPAYYAPLAWSDVLWR